MPTSGEIREPDKVAVGLQVLLLGTSGIEPFLAEVARWAAGTVGSAHSCGLTVSATARTPRMGATSDELAQRMDAVQYDVEDGPCLTCLRDGIIVRVGDLGTDSRWPAFAARGRQEGVGASLSVPMLVGDHVAGAVNLYATKRYSLNEEDLGRARHFADQAAGAVALAVRLAEREEKAKNLEIALTSRSTIDQALGIVMAQAHISAEEAFQVLRARSQHRNIKIRDVAAAAIAELADTRLRPRDRGTAIEVSSVEKARSALTPEGERVPRRDPNRPYARTMSGTQERARPRRLAGALSDITSRLVDRHDPGTVLTQIIAACRELLDAAAIGVMITNPGGGLVVIAASDEQARFVELLQAQTAQGPCVDCIRTGQIVAAPDLRAERRWPTFTPAAVDAGYRAIHALPMRLGEDTIGGLNLLYAPVTQLPPERLELARTLADLASLALSQEHDARRFDRFAETALSTLNDRITIAQATGMIAAALRLSPDRARAALADYATRHDRPLREIASALTERTLDPTDIPTSTQ